MVKLFYQGLMVLVLVMPMLGTNHIGQNIETLIATKACQGCKLVGAHLENAQLPEASLEGANLAYAHLSGANLTGARLDHANLEHAHLDSITLNDASLTNANLINADLSNADLVGANLAHAELINTDLSDATLTHADLTGTRLQNSYLTGAELSGTIMDSAIVDGADFSKTVLSKDTDFSNVDLARAKNAFTLWPHFIGTRCNEGTQFPLDLGCENNVIQQTRESLMEETASEKLLRSAETEHRKRLKKWLGDKSVSTRYLPY